MLVYFINIQYLLFYNNVNIFSFSMTRHIFNMRGFHRMLKLTKQNVTKQKLTAVNQSPIKVLQVGEGNFLRGFADWMIFKAIQKEVFSGGVVVTQPRASGKRKIDELKEQDGLYTLVTRGISSGKQVEEVDIINVFTKLINPYEEWESFLELAKEQELRFVISNTTEAGLVYTEEKLNIKQPIHSFAGKLTALLYKRFEYFHGDEEKGLICLPCELLERNGDVLKELVLQYAYAWKLSNEFIGWVTQHNYFLNSLVDRIVTGYPAEEQAQKWFEEWGYLDKQLTTAEPYHLWAIEGDELIAEQFPLASAGLNVLWVSDLKQYQKRKVAILNGSHTSLALLGLLYGEHEVRLAMENTELSSLIKSLIKDEVVPTLLYDTNELLDYAEQVYERFQNPFIQHRLHDIAMNSLSKFNTRLMPSILYYLEEKGQLPPHLLIVFAGLIRHYKVTMDGEHYMGTTLSGNTFLIRDNVQLLQFIHDVWASYKQHLNIKLTIFELLSNKVWWGDNLAEKYPNLINQLTNKLTEMEWI